MLYPTSDLNYPGNPYTLESGSLGVLGISLEAGHTITLKMHQIIGDPTNMAQDQSIRCWISALRGGASVVENPITASRWHLSALQMDEIVLYDVFTVTPPEGKISVPLAPGSYWLNVLNLVNQKNQFALDISGD